MFSLLKCWWHGHRIVASIDFHPRLTLVVLQKARSAYGLRNSNERHRRQAQGPQGLRRQGSRVLEADHGGGASAGLRDPQRLTNVMQYKRVPHWRVLSDFLKGVSVASLARRYRRPRAWVESVLREAM